MPVLHVQGAKFDYHQKIKGQTNRNLLGATTSLKQIEFSKVSGYASKDFQSFLGKASIGRVLHTWSKGKVKTLWVLACLQQRNWLCRSVCNELIYCWGHLQVNWNITVEVKHVS